MSQLSGTDPSFFNCIIAQSPDGSVIHNLARLYFVGINFPSDVFIINKICYAEVSQYKNKNVCYNMHFSLIEDMKSR